MKGSIVVVNGFCDDFGIGGFFGALLCVFLCSHAEYIVSIMYSGGDVHFISLFIKSGLEIPLWGLKSHFVF